MIALSALLGMFALSAIAAAPVSALPSQTLYGCDGSDSAGPASLYTINVNTGVVTLIGSMVNDYGCSAMDFSPGGNLVRHWI